MLRPRTPRSARAAAYPAAAYLLSVVTPHRRSPAAAPPPRFLPSARRRVPSSAGSLRFLPARRARGGGTGPSAPAAPAGSRGPQCPDSTLRSRSSGADRTSATRGSGSGRGCRSACCLPFSLAQYDGIHPTGSRTRNLQCTPVGPASICRSLHSFLP